MPYRREATTRVATFSAVAVVSAAAGLGAAALITALFPHDSAHVRDNVFGYSFAAVFAIICSVAVYQTDKKLNRKFNQNP